ncbi:Gfo/Idh/MocA family oxidoreductase [bacterium]|nr:Gfo/Idh/MocA family oxidoreductase [bacterium]
MAKNSWGVIGAGGIADRRMIPEGILDADNARLAALVDVDAGRLEELGRKYAGVKTYKTAEELLTDPNVQSVYIATPNHLHREQCLKAIAAGKHVLCEKPLAMNTAEGREIVDAARKANVRLGCDYMMRYNVYHQHIRDLVREGRVGTPVMGRAQLTCWYPRMEGAWRQEKAKSGGGAIVDLATHCLDLLESILGRITHVFCFAETRVQDYEVDDTSLLSVKFESGALGVVDCHFNVPDEASENVLEIYGSLGCIKTKLSIGQGPAGEMIECLLHEAGGYEAEQQREVAGYREIVLEGPNTYRSIVEAFGRAVEEGRDPEISGEEGLWSLAVTEAAYESARTGRLVEVKKPR